MGIAGACLLAAVGEYFLRDVEVGSPSQCTSSVGGGVPAQHSAHIEIGEEDSREEPISHPVDLGVHGHDDSFGYAGGPAARSETRDAFGIVRGSYNYVDSDGKIQTQHYVADALGFRVSGTNLPVAPDAPEAAPLALPGPLPEPVTDTPEVAAAKAAHQAAYDEAAADGEAAPDRKKRSVLAAPFLSAYSPLRGFSYGFSAPVTYGHPALYGLGHTLGPYVHAAHTYAPYSAIPAVNYSKSLPSAGSHDIQESQ
ncbi:uncharacterized protein [Macrobrachium rosenbergii]|uniref:uncharacterized protein n=1 Tax=Macrobrachium rosenbergii TaxID=79674 RepID=UPI0034D3EBCD